MQTDVRFYHVLSNHGRLQAFFIKYVLHADDHQISIF